MKSYHIEVQTLDPGIYNRALEIAQDLGGSRESGDMAGFVVRFEDKDDVKAFLDYLVEFVHYFKLEVY